MHNDSIALLLAVACTCRRRTATLLCSLPCIIQHTERLCWLVTRKLGGSSRA